MLWVNQRQDDPYRPHLTPLQPRPPLDWTNQACVGFRRRHCGFEASRGGGHRRPCGDRSGRPPPVGAAAPVQGAHWPAWAACIPLQPLIQACQPAHPYTSMHAHVSTCQPAHPYTSMHTHVSTYQPAHPYTSMHAHVSTCQPAHPYTSMHAHVSTYQDPDTLLFWEPVDLAAYPGAVPCRAVLCRAVLCCARSLFLYIYLSLSLPLSLYIYVYISPLSLSLPLPLGSHLARPGRDGTQIHGLGDVCEILCS